MHKTYLNIPKDIIKNLTLISAVFSLSCLFFTEDLYCADSVSGAQTPESKKGTVIFGRQKSVASTTQQTDKLQLSELQEQARLYRGEGLEAQARGDLATAMSYYQKAIELDPSYAVAYNDLGIIYEARGLLERAEESYLKAIKIEPHNLSSYSNLGLLYENKRDLNNAAFYWRKRAELGEDSDPWTIKARERYEDIALVLGKSPFDYSEQQVLDLVKEVANEKQRLRQDNRELSKHHFEKAKLSFQKGDDLTAFKEAERAHQLDPANDSINDFLDKIQTRILSK